MTITVYEVLREHHGDRDYKAGDHRELDAMSAQHLVKLGVLKATKRKPADPPADPVGQARGTAEVEIAALADKVKVARAAADDELGVLAQKQAEARQAAEAEIAAIRRNVAEVRAQAEVELAEIAADRAAKAEAAGANKAEPLPTNKSAKG